MANFNRFLKNKRVCIVGASGALKDSDQGEYIDSFDIVVRVNAGFPINTNMVKDLGKRCDVFYLGSIGVRLWLKNPKVWPLPKKQVSWLVLVKHLPDHKLYKQIQEALGINTRGIYKNWRDEMQKEVGWPLPSGYISILDLLRFDLKELYITGFDFYKNRYYQDYGVTKYAQLNTSPNKSYWNPKHYIKFREHFQKLVEKDKRIKFDKVLQEVLDDQ